MFCSVYKLHVNYDLKDRVSAAIILLIKVHQINDRRILKVQSRGIMEITFFCDRSSLFTVHLSPAETVETEWCSDLKQVHMHDVKHHTVS